MSEVSSVRINGLQHHLNEDHTLYIGSKVVRELGTRSWKSADGEGMIRFIPNKQFEMKEKSKAESVSLFQAWKEKLFPKTNNFVRYPRS